MEEKFINKEMDWVGGKVYTKSTKTFLLFSGFEVDDQFNSRSYSSPCIFLPCFALYKDRRSKTISRASIQNGDLPITDEVR
jgi:hypothetical protein